MRPEELRELLAPVLAMVHGRKVDQELAVDLNATFPPDSDVFAAVQNACHQGIAQGWLCPEGDEGRRFGRIFEATAATCELSIDVVDVRDMAGPHHRHPRGEILMIMPVTPSAKFDGNGKGWMVYEPGTAHHPTVSDGEAIVLYLLPDGEIDWTGE